MFNYIKCFRGGFSHLRLTTLHENYVKKANFKATYILAINFKVILEFKEKP